jgi:hypothetical protein
MLWAGLGMVAGATLGIPHHGGFEETSAAAAAPWMWWNRRRGSWQDRLAEARSDGVAGAVVVDVPTGRLVSADDREYAAVVAALTDLPRTPARSPVAGLPLYLVPTLNHIYQLRDWALGARRTGLVAAVAPDPNLVHHPPAAPRLAVFVDPGTWTALRGLSRGDQEAFLADAVDRALPARWTVHPVTRPPPLDPAVAARLAGTDRLTEVGPERRTRIRTLARARGGDRLAVLTELALLVVDVLARRPGITTRRDHLVEELLPGVPGGRELLRDAVDLHPRLRRGDEAAADEDPSAPVSLLAVDPINPNPPVGEPEGWTAPEPTDEARITEDDPFAAPLFAAFDEFVDAVQVLPLDPPTRRELLELLGRQRHRLYWSPVPGLSWVRSRPDADPVVSLWRPAEDALSSADRDRIRGRERQLVSRLRLLGLDLTPEQVRALLARHLMWHELGHIVQVGYGRRGGGDGDMEALGKDILNAGLSVSLAVQLGAFSSSERIEKERFAEGLANALLVRYLITTYQLDPVRAHYLPAVLRAFWTAGWLAVNPAGTPTGRIRELPGYLHYYDPFQLSLALEGLRRRGLARPVESLATTPDLVARHAGTRPERELVARADAVRAGVHDPSLWGDAWPVIHRLGRSPGTNGQLLVPLAALLGHPNALAGMRLGFLDGPPGWVAELLAGEDRAAPAWLGEFWATASARDKLALGLLVAVVNLTSSTEMAVWLPELPERHRTANVLLDLLRWLTDPALESYRFPVANLRLGLPAPGRQREVFLAAWVELMRAMVGRAAELGPDHPVRQQLLLLSLSPRGEHVQRLRRLVHVLRRATGRDDHSGAVIRGGWGGWSRLRWTWVLRWLAPRGVERGYDPARPRGPPVVELPLTWPVRAVLLVTGLWWLPNRLVGYYWAERDVVVVFAPMLARVRAAGRLARLLAHEDEFHAEGKLVNTAGLTHDEDEAQIVASLGAPARPLTAVTVARRLTGATVGLATANGFGSRSRRSWRHLVDPLRRATQPELRPLAAGLDGLAAAAPPPRGQYPRAWLDLAEAVSARAALLDRLGRPDRTDRMLAALARELPDRAPPDRIRLLTAVTESLRREAIRAAAALLGVRLPADRPLELPPGAPLWNALVGYPWRAEAREPLGTYLDALLRTGGVDQATDHRILPLDHPLCGEPLDLGPAFGAYLAHRAIEAGLPLLKVVDGTDRYDPDRLPIPGFDQLRPERIEITLPDVAGLRFVLYADILDARVRLPRTAELVVQRWVPPRPPRPGGGGPARPSRRVVRGELGAAWCLSGWVGPPGGCPPPRARGPPPAGVISVLSLHS